MFFYKYKHKQHIYIYIYIYIDDIRININVFSAAKHNIIATHIANKKHDIHCFIFEHIITISYL